ncbi:phosphatase PAP2 family protein [Actinomadura napierensis]|uniref:Inositolphosphotransferase Aur1/Ipt1 domain-containing protein n=1 Tax=Actinomadura napierensis TaxID=267854 RepID=A0ABN3AA91_9ACTN
MSLLEQPSRPVSSFARLRRPGRPEGGRPGGRPGAVRELVLIAVLFTVYKLGRLLANDRVGEAFGNAHRIWDIERALDLPSEVHVQHELLHSQFLVHVANCYYAYVHFPAMALFLLWIYLRRPRHYRWIRRVLVALTAGALALHLLVPLAPPRMLPATGLIDTATRFGPSVYGSPQQDTMANQYAAMPSLHIGWAAIIAIGLVLTCRTRWRWLWLLHPVLTIAVVVSTANHYWMDGIVVLALLAVAVLLLRPPVPARTAGGPPAAPGGTRAEPGAP